VSGSSSVFLNLAFAWLLGTFIFQSPDQLGSGSFCLFCGFSLHHFVDVNLYLFSELFIFFFLNREIVEKYLQGEK
jgi:hypothetical protein